MKAAENKENGDDLEEEIWKDVFSTIKGEIADQKKKEDFTVSSENEAKNCKICGKNLPAPIFRPHCSHCGFPACSKCRTSQLCLYCFTNLRAPFRRIIKLYKIVLYGAPLIVLLVGLAFSSFLNFLLYSIMSFGLLYIILQLFIMGLNIKPKRFFAEEWEEIINSDDFKATISDVRPLRYISPALYSDYLDHQFRKIKNLENWVQKAELVSKTPIPTQFEANQWDKQNLMDKFKNKITIPLDHAEIEFEPYENFEFNYNGKQCPNCQNIIQFGNFCIECNLKFCPKCGIESNPYSLRCVCGFEFPDLAQEFEAEMKSGKKVMK